jgi:hypothetical protein
LLIVARFRLETADDSLQPTIDMLLNISVFLWFGAVCPWASFRSNDVIPVYRLIFLGILILLFRRIPMIFAMHKKIRQIEEFQQAAFVGFFGPIGVSAIFYLYVSLDFLNQVTVDGVIREDAARLQEVMRVVIWFLAICSIVVHGLSVPLGKLGYHFPRTISQALSSDREDDEPDLHIRRSRHFTQPFFRRRKAKNKCIEGASDRQPSPAVFWIGKPEAPREGADGELRRPVHFPDDTPTGAQTPGEPNRPIHYPIDTPPDETRTPAERDVGERGQDMEMSKMDRPVNSSGGPGVTWKDEGTKEP